MKKIYVLLFVLLLTYGCTQDRLDRYYELEASEINRTDIMELPEEPCDYSDENCICMVCENSFLFDFYNPFNQFYSMDLREGTCRFEQACSEEKFTEISETPGIGGLALFGARQPRFFMLGHGSNFAEFADATRYCNNSLRLAVRWLATSEGFEYPMPAKERAQCFMEKDVMPMYLLYSEGTAVDSSRAATIAATFSNAGPVIITSEFDFDPSNITQIEEATYQAISMKARCPNCLVAIAPRFEYSRNETDGRPYGYNHTYDALKHIFLDGPYASQARDSIDLVAVGVNSHYSRGCSGVGLIYDALAYSKHSLYVYGKPTVWAYVLLDEGQYNSGGIEEGTCAWGAAEVVKTYSDLYKYIPAIVDGGVIGAAPYSLYGLDTGPLECGSCGMMHWNGTTYPEHSLWFSNCQVYYTWRGVTPIVFSPEPCADCSYANNFNLYQIGTVFYGQSPTAENLAGISPMQTFFRCNAQMMTKVPDEIDLSGFVPSISDQKCEIYPELDIFSDLRDADPVLTRAFAWGETGLNNPEEGPGGDMCAASQIPAASCNDCVDYLTDPDGICGTFSPQQGNQFHSVGIMQTHTYPYAQWGEVNNVHYRKEAEWCGRNEFNPFNKAHNACLGTAIILDKLNGGKPIVSQNEQKLGLTQLKTEYGESSEEYLNMKNAYTIFISSYRYSGYSTFNESVVGWIQDFSDQGGITEDYCEVVAATGHPCCHSDGTVVDSPCCNQGNFINYYRGCVIPLLEASSADPAGTKRKAEYGLRLLGHYKALLNCEKYNSAQQKQNLIDYMEEYGGMEEPAEPLEEP